VDPVQAAIGGERRVEARDRAGVPVPVR
jgi:hypothetical protein